MRSIWIDPALVAARCARHEAFWQKELEDGPLLWITAPLPKPGTPPREPDVEEALWTDVEYVLAKAEYDLSRTYFAGDALPVHHPWLGPDQFAAWLGAEMELKPRDNTSWIRPFVGSADGYPEFCLDPSNRWWKLYLEIVRASVERGKDKWITAYPDLHTGIDGLAAIRSPEMLMFDLLESPETVHRAMARMTELWKEIVDLVSSIVLPAGQGTTNWTMGWSSQRFLCIGQNDFTCLIGPQMFDAFCLDDTVQCANHADRTIYHLDGAGALKHLPRLLEIERLDCIQWIQGANQPLPSQWLELLNRIQAAGKSVQLFYAGAHGGNADFRREMEALLGALDPRRLFLVIEARSVEEADTLVRTTGR
ncbi:MAG: hypothetical protein JXB10_02085 [Pirellulales bacterium]|nr:hypothetical protein [Pirellulales bacterium]